MRRWDENRQKQVCAAAVVCLAAISLFFYSAGRKAEMETIRLRASNEAAESYRRHRMEPIWAEGQGESGTDALGAAVEAVRMRGIAVDTISEMNPEELAHGEIHGIQIEGTGTFEEVLQLFDTIHEDRRWLRVDVDRIERKGTVLQYEMEIKEYRPFQGSW